MSQERMSGRVQSSQREMQPSKEVPVDPSSGRRERIASAIGRLRTYVDTAKLLPERERKLKDRQLVALERIAKGLEAGFKKGYFVMPTGSGKTVVFTELLRALGLRTLVIVPRRILRQDTAKELAERRQAMPHAMPHAKMPANLESAEDVDDLTEEDPGDLDLDELAEGLADVSGELQVITYELAMNIARGVTTSDIRFEEIDLFILDEVHRGLSEARMQELPKVFSHGLCVGTTATEDYSGKKRVRHLLEERFDNVTIPEAVNEGLISSFQTRNMRVSVDTRSIPVVSNREGKKEFSPRIVTKLFNTPEHNARVVADYFDHDDGEIGIVRGASVEHCFAIAEEFDLQAAAQGYPTPFAQVVHGKMSEAKQIEIIEAHKRGVFPILVTRDLAKEGYNNPRIGVTITAMPVFSPVDCIQFCGRGTRLHPDDSAKVKTIVNWFNPSDTRTQIFSKYAGGATVLLNKFARGSGGGGGGHGPRKTSAKSPDVLVDEEVQQFLRRQEDAEVPLIERDSGWYTQTELLNDRSLTGGRDWNEKFIVKGIAAFETKYPDEPSAELRRRAGERPYEFFSPTLIAYLVEEGAKEFPPSGSWSETALERDLSEILRKHGVTKKDVDVEGIVAQLRQERSDQWNIYSRGGDSAATYYFFAFVEEAAKRVEMLALEKGEKKMEKQIAREERQKQRGKVQDVQRSATHSEPKKTTTTISISAKESKHWE